MITMPKCIFCSNLFEEEGMSCTAFPEGIPHEFAWEDEEKECNNGIKFIRDK